MFVSVPCVRHREKPDLLRFPRSFGVDQYGYSSQRCIFWGCIHIHLAVSQTCVKSPSLEENYVQQYDHCCTVPVPARTARKTERERERERESERERAREMERDTTWQVTNLCRVDCHPLALKKLTGPSVQASTTAETHTAWWLSGVTGSSSNPPWLILPNLYNWDWGAWPHPSKALFLINSLAHRFAEAPVPSPIAWGLGIQLGEGFKATALGFRV